MPAKVKLKIESRFPAVKEAAYETVVEARDRALADGLEVAQSKIGKAVTARGYRLDPGMVKRENIGHQSGRLFVNEWWARFFEYGTVYIKSLPFMRPASRKMRKTFVAMLSDDFEGWVRRKAKVTRR